MRPKLPAVRLPMWAGFRAGKTKPVSEGEVAIAIHEERVRPAHEVARAFAVAEAERMQPVLLRAIVEAYPTLRAWKPRPKSVTLARLRGLVDLWEITLMRDHHAGHAYVRYSFSCAWDPSGVVVIAHRDRIVAVGGLEVSTHPVSDPERAKPTPPRLTPAMVARARARASAAAKRNPKELRQDVSVSLPPWAGFRPRPYDPPVDGEVSVELADGGPITVEAAEAYRFSLAHAERLRDVVLQSIVDAYPRLSAPFVRAGVPMPAVRDVASLRELVALTSLTIHQAHASGLAYVGYSLECAWDREHALGVMTHRERVVAVGGADTAILGWIARRDLDAGSGPPKPGTRSARPAGAAAKSKRAVATSSGSPRSSRPR